MGQAKVLLIGGGGFIGQQIASKLASLGHKIIIPTRRFAHVKDLWVLPQAQIIEADIHNQDVLNQLCARLSPEDVVINLVGILHDKPAAPYGKNFAKAHVELPKKIIEAMKKNGIKRYLHMSALGADSSGPSMYQRSKGDGEALVKQSHLDWTIFRPSVVFGENDSFINLFASLQQFAPVMPLAGASVKFQPVYVSDVATAFVKAIKMPQTVGHAYDLVGPKVYTLAELVKFAGRKAGRSRPIIPIPAVLGYLQAWLLEFMPGPTVMSRDNIASMKIDSILPPGAQNPLEEDFGIAPQPLEVLLK
jgi:NADH dehydrogenase